MLPILAFGIHRASWLAAMLLLLNCWAGNAFAIEVDPDSQYGKLAKEILAELVNFESTADKPEQTRLAAEAMNQRLLEAGLPAADVQVINPKPGKFGLVARIRGIQDQRPLLTMAHIDVVGADRGEWEFPPFTFGEKDGYYFGRGTQDNKTGAAHLVTTFIRLLDEKFVPNRDLIMMLTGDEETAGDVAKWLAGDGRELIDAEFALNTDGGGGEYSDDFKPKAFMAQTSEKVYQTYLLNLANPGGHSSLPRQDNAINDLAAALVEIADYRFPLEVSAEAKQMLERAAELETGQKAADLLDVARNGANSPAAERLTQDPFFNAQLRTTCVATEIHGGHAENALPLQATATINCRALPGTDPAEVLAKLREVAANPAIEFTSIYDAIPSPPSVMPAALQESLETLVDEFWPDVPVVPEMTTGATDGLFMRNAGIPVFGVAAWFMRPGDVRAHGLNEKVGIKEFHEGNEFWYRMLKVLSQP